MTPVYGLIPDRYLMEMHCMVVQGIVADLVAEDGTEYSGSRFIRWYDVQLTASKTSVGTPPSIISWTTARFDAGQKTGLPNFFQAACYFCPKVRVRSDP